jgi:hypothetical protein
VDLDRFTMDLNYRLSARGRCARSPATGSITEPRKPTSTRPTVTLFRSDYDDIQVTNSIFTRCDGFPDCDGPLTQLPNLHLTNAAATDYRNQ